MQRMTRTQTNIIRDLLNLGHLTLKDVAWLQVRGYEVTINNGIVSNVKHNGMGI